MATTLVNHAYKSWIGNTAAPGAYGKLKGKVLSKRGEKNAMQLTQKACKLTSRNAIEINDFFWLKFVNKRLFKDVLLMVDQYSKTTQKGKTNHWFTIIWWLINDCKPWLAMIYEKSRKLKITAFEWWTIGWLMMLKIHVTSTCLWLINVSEWFAGNLICLTYPVFDGTGGGAG